jgi:single-strand DNA-binding protein
MQRGSVNRVILVGYLGADPESRFTAGGNPVATFNLATNETRKNAEGEFEETTEWHRCVLFGKPAETANEYLKKGRLIYLEGRLRTRSWEDKNGVKRYTTEVVGERFTMLGRRPDVAETPPAAAAEEEDLPF